MNTNFYSINFTGEISNNSAIRYMFQMLVFIIPLSILDIWLNSCQQSGY
nr:hypothetical protein [Bacteroidota bacterium]